MKAKEFTVKVIDPASGGIVSQRHLTGVRRAEAYYKTALQLATRFGYYVVKEEVLNEKV